jgi:WD40 repeat protein
MQNQQGNVDALAWSPDGQIIAGGDGVNLWQKDGSLLETQASFGRVDGLAWSPSGQLLASRSTDAGLRLWSADGRLLDSFPGRVIMVAWSPDGQLLAAASVNNNVQLWRIRLSVGIH